MKQPHDRLEAAIAAGLVPNGVQPHDLRRVYGRWVAWCRADGRDTLWLSPEAGSSWLEHLLETETPRTAYAQFANFQIAAGLAWGPETSAHLALTLRASRVRKKKAPADRWARALQAIDRLPPDWLAPLRTLLERSRDNPTTRGSLIWSAARIEAVAAALTRFHAFALKEGKPPLPTASLCQQWAESLVLKAAAISVACYLSRVIDGFEKVLTPGIVYDAAAAVADRWSVRSSTEAPRKGKAGRIVPASELDRLGFAMMAEADAAPLRRISEATLYRDGLLLALAATLPERARALSALAFDTTIFLEPDGVIYLAIPGEHLKIAERRKRRRGFHVQIRRPSLHRALARWRAVYRPMFDDGAWLWPSRLDRDHGLTENTIGRIAARVTEARLGRSVSIHLVRDCVATEMIEIDPLTGAAQATAALRHRDAGITNDFYVHADGIACATRWQAALDTDAGRESLRI